MKNYLLFALALALMPYSLAQPAQPPVAAPWPAWAAAAFVIIVFAAVILVIHETQKK